MAELARAAGRAARKLPVDHHARADPAVELEVDHVGAAVAGAPRELRERLEVGLVVDGDRNPQLVAQLLGDVHRRPAGQDRRRRRCPGRAVDRAREADPGAEQPVAVDAPGVERLGHRVGDRRHPLLGGVLVQLADRRPEHAVREIRDDDAHVPEADVDADRRAGARVERHRPARAAGRAARRPQRVAALDHHPARREVGDRGRHRRVREPERARQLGPAHGPALAQEYQQALVRPRLPAGAWRRHSARA